jgi:cell division protein FtsB
VKQANRRGGDRSGRLGGYLPETITTRTLVLSVVVLLVFVLLVPTAREYAKQTAQLNSLQTELTQAQQQRADDTANLKRWDDPAFVKAQARARLGYVMPGEKAYRVTDPGAVRRGSAPPPVRRSSPASSRGPPATTAPGTRRCGRRCRSRGQGPRGTEGVLTGRRRRRRWPGRRRE